MVITTHPDVQGGEAPADFRRCPRARQLHVDVTVHHGHGQPEYPLMPMSVHVIMGASGYATDRRRLSNHRTVGDPIYWVTLGRNLAREAVAEWVNTVLTWVAGEQDHLLAPGRRAARTSASVNGSNARLRRFGAAFRLGGSCR
jgi:hypothetical protein